MQQTSTFIALANDIEKLQTYNRLYELMNNFENLQQIFLFECEKSEKLLFVACQMLSKKLLNRELLTSPDDIDANYDTQTFENRKFSLFKIAGKLYDIIGRAANKIQQYLIRSCLNTISLCMYATLSINSSFEPAFTNYLKMLAPDFKVNQALIKPNDSFIALIEPSKSGLSPHHQYCIQILCSLLQYVTNSTFSQNYYHFRRSLYSFRNNYLMYYLNYGIYCLKSVFYITINNFGGSTLAVCQSIRPALKLFENIIMYPFSLNMHEFQIEDDIHENISGLQTEIYFPSYFRSLLCDTGFLMDIITYYSRINLEATIIDPVREDLYSLIRLIGRILSTSQYVFVGGQQQKKAFRALSVEFVTRILKQNKFFDSYLILCISKINIKFMSVENQDEMFLGKKSYFDALIKFILKGLTQCKGRIEDGDKHPFRQLFQMLTAFVNIAANTVMDTESKNCAQEALNILFKVRLVNNEENAKLMREFGFNNGQQIDCFGQIFGRVTEIFKINLPVNLLTLHELNLSALNSESLTFWLHLTSLLLPEHDTSVEQTQLIIKFLEAAIKACSIASLNFIQTLMEQILYELKDGVSTTYLWKFIQQSKGIKFEQFLSYIIEYAMKILTVPNYVLIQNCLQLFKAMFTKLCKYRHRSFIRYFEIIEQVCKQIDKTMLVRPDFMKLRIGFFSIISIIWINEGQISFVYRIFTNVRQSLGQNTDLIHLARYLTDITGLLEPVGSSEVYKLLMELVLVDMKSILPFYFGTPEKLKSAFSDQVFLKTFIKFIYTAIDDNGFRMTLDSHTQLPFQIEQTFRPYLVEALNYDYPQKLVETWLKFIKLNPLGKLLPLERSLKEKNSPMYKSLIRQYFQNLHRLGSIDQFYYMYAFIDDNIDLLVDWWEEIMARQLRPNVSIALVANAHIWVNSRQKEQFGKLLYRVSKYDSRYWAIQCDANTENKYAEWFVANYK